MAQTSIMDAIYLLGHNFILKERDSMETINIDFGMIVRFLGRTYMFISFARFIQDFSKKNIKVFLVQLLLLARDLESKPANLIIQVILDY